MADLHDVLRPSDTPEPPPIAELARRANRRKRRRVAKATGAVVAVAAIAVSLGGLPETPQSVTVADGKPNVSDVDGNTDAPPQPSTSEPELGEEHDAPVPTSTAPPLSTTEPESAAPPSSATEPDSAAPSGPDAPDTIAEARPRATPGLQTEVTTTSRWHNGYCFQIDLVNDTADTRTWSLTIDTGGTIATIWNAVVVEDEAGTSVFAGEDGYNVTIEPGVLTTFGACVDTE